MKWFAVFFFLLPVTAETLHYTINWQSGLSLGEATLRSDPSVENRVEGGSAAGGWEFELMLDASVPGFAIRDRYESNSDAQFCSSELKKTVSRGSRKSQETVKFDQQKMTVTREGLPGTGKSSYSVPPCAHDAMAYLRFVRQELAQGRLAPHQQVILGAAYEVQLTYIGTESIRIGDRREEADKVRTSIKGPKSDITIELYFSHDAVRTPLLAKLPLPLGMFTVELLP
jgi:hypothetical protein